MLVAAIALAKQPCARVVLICSSAAPLACLSDRQHLALTRWALVARAQPNRPYKEP